MKLVKPLAAVAAVVGLAVLPVTAGAAPPKSLWVAPAPVVVASVPRAVTPAVTNTSCATAAYHTIQSAIAAARAGATINICAGTYVEQLTITQSVSLVAVGAVTVALPVGGGYHGTLSVEVSDLRGNAARVLTNSLNYTVFQLLNL